MEFRSATDVLLWAGEYLDSLCGVPPADETEARERMKHLISLRREMDRYNFKNPMFAVQELAKIFQELRKDMDREELAEMLVHVREIKYSMDVRKWTYERARAAYVSNRAAFYIIKWGVFKYLLDFLPYGGEYLANVEKHGSCALAVFWDLLKDRLFGHSVSFKVFLSCLVSMRAPYVRVESDARVSEYERIVKKYLPEELMTNEEKMIGLLNELEEKGFLVDGAVDPQILRKLQEKRRKKFTAIKDGVVGEMRDFFTVYYTVISYRERKNHPLFLGLPPNPENLANYIHTDVLGESELILNAYRVKREVGGALLARKLGFEKVSRMLGIPVDELRKGSEFIERMDKDRILKLLQKWGEE